MQPTNPLGIYDMVRDLWGNTRQPLKQRGKVLPIGEYEDGSLGLAWPGLVATPAEAWKRMVDKSIEGDESYFSSPQLAIDSFDAASAAMTGGLATGLAGGMVDNALGSAGGKIAQAAERQGAGKAMAPRPEPEGLIPKAGAMGADAAPQGVSSGLAETAPISVADYIAQVKGLVDDGAEGPFYGPSTGPTGSALDEIYEQGFTRELDRRSGGFDDWEYDDNGISARSPYYDDATRYGYSSLERYSPYVAAGIEDAANATGRTLPMYQASSGSSYGTLETPAGNSYKVRVADHARTSSQFDRPDFNIAPGAMTPEEFLQVLPTIYSNAKPGASIPLATQAAEQQAPRGIRAYHGSPHDFDQFSLDKIGTGEGAQAYGHGLYFAESEDVARSYMDALGMVGSAHSLRVNGQPFDGSNPVHIAADELANAVDVNDAIARLQGFADKTEGETASLYRAAAEHLRANGAPEYSFDDGFSGKMYEVNINADPNDFLDWDKPLSQQPEAAQRVAAEYFNDLQNETGRSLLERYAYLGNEIEQQLKAAGIPGIRYRDGMSRGAGDGTANYVVFDDQLIDILRKYANAPTGASIPLGLEAQQEDVDPALMEYLRLMGQ